MPDLVPIPGADQRDNVLRFDRWFDGAPSLIFAMWTQPALLQVWFGASHGFRAEVTELDPRPGGRWRITNRKGDVTEHPEGVYHEVVADRRLVYGYHYAGTAFRSTVSVDLSPEGQGTRMRFCQTGFPDAGAFDGHGMGWQVVWKLFGEALLAAHGVGSVVPGLPAERIDGVRRDLEAARARHEGREAAE
jgi:uncharacterized protein YndB with AHSA1/START domain